ncbi:unnamed protein product [Cladocopium goreaui]|uniref:Uncharacterized protein n=1 Tax=Cladocopium goreaui TaxID=2562237 RepID=A0A9P1G189_9DINO|nr:unnamed protein product [Cladocopium goreaui]
MATGPAVLTEMQSLQNSGQPAAQRRRLENGSVDVAASSSTDPLVQDLLRLTLYRSQDVQALLHSNSLRFLLTTDETKTSAANAMASYKHKQEEQHGGDIAAARAAARAKGEALAPHPWGHKKYFNLVMLTKTFLENGDQWTLEQKAAADRLVNLSPDQVDLEVAACSSKFSSPMDNRTWKFSLFLTAAASDETRNDIRTLLQAKSTKMKFEPSRDGGGWTHESMDARAPGSCLHPLAVGKLLTTFLTALRPLRTGMSSILSVSVRNYDYSLHTIIHFTHVLSGWPDWKRLGRLGQLHYLSSAANLNASAPTDLVQPRITVPAPKVQQVVADRIQSAESSVLSKVNDITDALREQMQQELAALKQQQQSTDAKMNQTIQQMAVTNQKMDETVNHVKTMETTVTSKYDELRKQNKDMEDKPERTRSMRVPNCIDKSTTVKLLNTQALSPYDKGILKAIFADGITTQKHLFVMKKVSYSWFVTMIKRNKFVHSMNGNMVPQFHNSVRKGYGKGKQTKGKTNAEQEELSFQEEIRNSLPDAAIQRMQPQLYPDDWDVPVRFPHDMHAQPGVYVRIQVRTSEAEIKEVTVKRFLIQVGFGAEVSQTIVGDQDLRATFMIHESFVTQLMKTSGREGVFFKIHSSSEAGYQFELLWLPDDVSHEQALQHAESDKVLGLVAKNAKQKPKYALRFSSMQDLQTFAEQYALPNSASQSRWRLDGLSPILGSAGVITLLEDRQWVIDSVLYFGERHCVFTASTVGNLTPMFYEVDGESQQMRFKALSLSARNSQIEANKKAKSQASSSAAATATNFGQQKASWLRSLRPKREEAAIPVSPAKNESGKRPAPAKTGETPPGKQNKET